MPTYQYKCTVCGEGLEVVQKFSDDPLTTCPSCQGRLRKVFSSVGIVFKGSGFYRTDSRSSSSSGSPAKKPAETAPAATGGDKGSTGSSGTTTSTSESTSSSTKSSSTDTAA